MNHMIFESMASDLGGRRFRGGTALCGMARASQTADTQEVARLRAVGGEPMTCFARLDPAGLRRTCCPAARRVAPLKRA